MNFIDIIIVLLFVTALARGVELGAIRQLCSTAGVFAGLFLGAFIQGKVIHLVHTPASKALLTVIIIIAMVGLLSSLGEYLGVLMRSRIERARRLKGIDQADRAAGSAIAGLAVLLVTWLAASMFSNIPAQTIQRQIQGSVIIAQLNKSLPSAPDVVSRLGHLIDPNSFPDVFMGLEPRIDTDAKLPSLGDMDTAVQAARLSVVKVQGTGCGGIATGSGFVADDGLVITNAHVVAGVRQPVIIDGNGRHSATVIGFDENLDIAILRANSLAGEPLDIEINVVPNSTPGVVLGYPGGGDFTASPASILDSFVATGRNIYNQGQTEREVYSVKAAIEPGNSGGPVVDKEGRVIAVVFAESTTYDDVGYALTMSDVISVLNNAKGRTAAVGTGACAQ